MTDARAGAPPVTSGTAIAAASPSSLQAPPPDIEKAANIVAYDQASAVEKQALDAHIEEIDLKNTNSILLFGAAAQEKLTEVSEQMLSGVRNKDVGPAGKSLSDMLLTLRGFDVGELDASQQPGFFQRIIAWLTGRSRSVAGFLQRYEQVRDQIDHIAADLERHRGILQEDIKKLDRLYDANLDYFRDLASYIAAGEEMLRRLDANIIPEKEKAAETSQDVIVAQELRDLRAARDDLARRVHDLKLTRQVTLQSLPSIRLVQENDKGLVSKMTSVLVNTVPLWMNQLSQAVTIFRMQEGAAKIKAATDLTNDLLEANARNLKEGNRQTREQLERGVFDIEAVKRANQSLVETIEDSLRIADEGARQRAQAERDLIEAEGDLRRALSKASAHASGASGAGAGAGAGAAGAAS